MQEEKDMKKDNDNIVYEAGLNVSGHILIRDKETGEELVNKRNAIPHGNMARVVVLHLKMLITNILTLLHTEVVEQVLTSRKSII